MKHCPSCDNEFTDESDVVVCPTCEAELTDGPNPHLDVVGRHVEPEEEEDPLVELVSVYQQMEADVILGALQQVDIECDQFPSAYVQTTQIPPVETSTNVSIRVRRKDLGEAHAILEELTRGQTFYCPECEAPLPGEDEPCPACGAKP
ncbi:MAG: hypothetical protein HYV63_29330 [Candidatus Schekmanbacteria bacterium]|nr:hypothetical protein [Candidatus Schekmanbacteria bacterium]